MGKKRKKSNQLQTYYISRLISMLISEHYKYFKNKYFNSFNNYFNSIVNNMSDIDEKEVYKVVDNILFRKYFLIFTHSSLTEKICLADVSGKEK